MEWYWVVLIVAVTICLTIAACAMYFVWSFRDFMQ